MSAAFGVMAELRGPYRLTDEEAIVDGFAGGGGASEGIFKALGRHPDIAINHNPDAIAVHARNHPDTQHFCESIWKVHPLEACGDRPVGLAWFSPDCFPAGTMVLTKGGYRPIEQIVIGDEVLTHKQRWRKVVETHSAVRPLLTIKGHGHPGLTVSPEHPFFARQRQDVWNTGTDGCTRGYRRTFDPADWVPASVLDKGWYWASPTNFPVEEVPEIPVYNDRILRCDENLLWLAGRYIADGWTRIDKTRAELVITCGDHKVDSLRTYLSAWPRAGSRSGTDEMAWHERKTATAFQFSTNSRGLVTWLREHFGHGASEKLIPGWALGMDDKLRTALLAGYLSGDGWKGAGSGSGITDCTTVSKALAFGIKALASSLGMSPCVYTKVNPSIIQGRVVEAKPAWIVRWRDDLKAAHQQTFREDGLEWTPIREQSEIESCGEVYNIGVDEDESYVVEGIIVHNCRHFSRAAGGRPKWKSVRSLPGIILTWAKYKRPKVICVENVPEMEDWGPLLDDGTPCPERKGRSFKIWVGRLRGMGYRVAWRRICAADFGDPTIRTRLFIVARCDGQDPIWPVPTHHRKPSLFEAPWRTAAECIDWTIPNPSIFTRAKPLKEATLRRIAEGIMRYIVNAENPFIVPSDVAVAAHISPFYGTASAGSPIDVPLGTVTAQGMHSALVTGLLAPMTHAGANRGSSLESPVPTLTGANRGEHALITGLLVPITHTGSPNRGSDIKAPVPVITTAKAGEQALITAIIGGCGGRAAQSPTKSADAPMNTITAKADQMLVTAFMAQHNGGVVGRAADEPLSTITAAGSQQQLVECHVAPAEDDEHMAGAARVHAFLLQYYSSGKQAQPLTDPLGTVPTHDRFALVTVAGVPMRIYDITMRMLALHELQAAQGFRPDYDLTDGGRLSKTKAIALIGNSVCPRSAAAVVSANVVRVRPVAPGADETKSESILQSA